MKLPDLTTCFLLAWIGVAILFDIWVDERFGVEATITRHLQAWVEEFPVLLLMLGCLLWHLFGKGQ